mmetsp:Transcript_43832/g.74826  ORF Transcript_43832/g.74826 Transcript_43832/m.74826 type:complete len:204 (+) Transcript_43832:1136-1747(+)|eukprot:CAMPEP_0183717936 /NCGR_PEP_ID=MMETSP0737-20130205/11351_1 /TAXON_ID=385413 /ORGANISM="Thalassiosira miniscula, Strain CCMP1093" /LENGTH=203 /DNA_ID=CAMNT_0025947413 /DNA_START=1096 /DNA_END=1707 /DNA_ORIENTATION=+
MPSNSKKKKAYLKERENGFDLRFMCSSSSSSHQRQIPTYDALRDVNMRRYFESPHVQDHLLKSGMIDPFGCIVDLEKHRSRLRVVENEIERAERLERLHEKDEEDARYLVRKERFHRIDRERRREDAERRKYERRMQLEITRMEREVLGQSHLWSENHHYGGRNEKGEIRLKLPRIPGASEAGRSRENALGFVRGRERGDAIF